MTDIDSTAGALGARAMGASDLLAAPDTAEFPRPLPSPRETMDDWQRRVWLVLRHRARLAAVIGFVIADIAGFLGAWSVVKTAPVWRSTTVMLIDDPYQLATSGDPGQLLKLQDLRYKYAALAGTEAIAGPVAAHVGLPVGAVEGAIGASPNAQALLIDVTGTWSSPTEAERLSSATAAALTQYVVTEEAAYNIPSTDRFVIRAIAPTGAAVASRPSSGNAAAHGVGYAVGGFAVGFVVTQLVRSRRKRGYPTPSYN